jgi:hypothetical protein
MGWESAGWVRRAAGRPYASSTDVHADCDGYTDTDAYTHLYLNTSLDADAHDYVDTHANCDGYIHTDTDAHTNCYTNTSLDTNAHAYVIPACLRSGSRHTRRCGSGSPALAERGSLCRDACP